jgi:hypothetical protein
VKVSSPHISAVDDARAQCLVLWESILSQEFPVTLALQHIEADTIDGQRRKRAVALAYVSEVGAEK